jgi:hypothetical protein
MLLDATEYCHCDLDKTEELPDLFVSHVVMAAGVVLLFADLVNGISKSPHLRTPLPALVAAAEVRLYLIFRQAQRCPLFLSAVEEEALDLRQVAAEAAAHQVVSETAAVVPYLSRVALLQRPVAGTPEIRPCSLDPTSNSNLSSKDGKPYHLRPRADQVGLPYLFQA